MAADKNRMKSQDKLLKESKSEKSIGEDKIFKNIKKDSNDSKEYRGVILKNELSVILISDPKIKSSACCLNVNIGSLNDPKEIEGLAHLLGNTLIESSTEKYPNKAELKKYVKKLKGDIRTRTKLDQTQYYFMVPSDNLEEVLDRFAQYFLNPIFDFSLIEKILDHNQSETAINDDEDPEIINNDSIFHKFACKKPKRKKWECINEPLELKTKLKITDVKERMTKFFSENYSSNIMSLCVLGRENLDELYEMVCKRIPFNKIANKNVKLNFESQSKNENLKKEHSKKQIKMVPHIIHDDKRLVFSLKMPDDFYKDPYHLTCLKYLNRFFFGSKENRLYTLLRSKGWIFRLRFLLQDLRIFFSLKEEGFEKIYEIISVVFQYLNLIRKEGPQQWVIEEYNKLAQIGLIDELNETDFSRILMPVVNITNKMQASDMAKDDRRQRIKIEDVVYSVFLDRFITFKPEKLNKFLNYLNPDNLAWILIETKNFEGKTNSKTKCCSREYSLEDISEERIKAWKNVGLNPDLELPSPYKLPTHSELVEPDEESVRLKRPILIKKDEVSDVWFLYESELKNSNTICWVKMINPLVSYDIVAKACMIIYEHILWTSTGLWFRDPRIILSMINRHEDGFVIYFNGPDKNQLNIALGELFEKLAQPFDKLIQSFDKVDKDFYNDPKCLEKLVFSKILLKPFCTPSELDPEVVALEKLNQILSHNHEENKKILLHQYVHEFTLENVKKYVAKFFSGMKISFFLYGNVTRKDLKVFEDATMNRLIMAHKPKPIPILGLPSNRIIKLENNSFNYLQESSTDFKDNFFMNYYQLGIVDSIDMKLKSIFLKHSLVWIKSEYLHNTNAKHEMSILLEFNNNVIGVCFMSLSKNFDCINHYIEEFLIFSRDYLEKLSNEEFEKLKNEFTLRFSTHSRRKESVNSKFQEYRYFVEDGKYEPDLRKTELEVIKKITKKDLFDFFDENLIKNKRKLSIRLISEKIKSTDDASLIKNLNDGLYELKAKRSHRRIQVLIDDLNNKISSDADKSKMKDSLKSCDVSKNGNQIIDVDEFCHGLELYSSKFYPMSNSKFSSFF